MKDDIERQLVPVFCGFYKRHLIAEIGDFVDMTQLEKLAWAAALDELAAEIRLLTTQQSMVG